MKQNGKTNREKRTMNTTAITVHTYPELSTIQVKANGIYKVSNITFKNNRPRLVIPTIIKILIKIKWQVFTEWSKKKFTDLFEELL